MNKISYKNSFEDFVQKVEKKYKPKDIFIRNCEIYISEKHNKELMSDVIYSIPSCSKKNILKYNVNNDNYLYKFIEKNINNVELIDNNIIDCIYQINNCIAYLWKKYEYVNNNLTLDNIVIEKEYFKIKDLGSSSITVDDYYLEVLRKDLYDGTTVKKFLDYPDCNKYKIISNTKNPVEDFLSATVKTCNLDIYCLIISIISNVEIFLPHFYKLCYHIFEEEDLNFIIKYVEINSKLSNVYSIIEFIINYQIILREDIFDIIEEFIMNDI